MSNVRDLGELGIVLQRIVTRLMNNQNLLKLLYYTDKDPAAGADLTEEQIKSEVYEKLIKIVPRIVYKETAQSIISLRVVRGETNPTNSEVQDLLLAIEVFVPLTQWFIKDSNLRPFAIMGEIEKSLRGKTINGLGKIEGGDFGLDFISDEVCAYIQTFVITTYD